MFHFYTLINFLHIDYTTQSSIGTSPWNAGGVCSGSSFVLRNHDSFFFGFEVLNGGQAKFCVQNDAQVALAPGNCDNGATTSSSCSSVTETSAFVMQGKYSAFV